MPPDFQMWQQIQKHLSTQPRLWAKSARGQPVCELQTPCSLKTLPVLSYL